MVKTRINVLKKIPKLKNPIFIEGLGGGVGNVGRIAAGYLAEQLKAEKFAELLSPHFWHFVLLHENASVHVLKNEFFFWKAQKKGQRDLVILVGDMQSIDPVGHYEIVEVVLDFVEKLGVKEMLTIGGFTTGKLEREPGVVGAVSHPELVEEYKKYKIDFKTGSKIGTIVGASGLFIGLGKYRGMKGVCLLGESEGLPEIPDPKSARAVLDALSRILNVKFDMSKMGEKIKEMENFMKKIQKVQARALSELLQQPQKKPKPKEELTYIG